MIHLIYLYLLINSFILGSYLLDSFNDDSWKGKLFISVVLFFFGGILLVFEMTVAEKVFKWWESSEVGFLWKLYVLKKYDNLDNKQIVYIEKKILAENNKNSKLYKHFKAILKRNGSKESS